MSKKGRHDEDEYDKEEKTEVAFRVMDRRWNSAVILFTKDNSNSKWKERVLEDKHGIVTKGSTYMGYLDSHDLEDWLKHDFDEVQEIDEEELDDILNSTKRNFKK